ncbi:MAG: hypothetical protein JEZ11_17950 [Desulfobacterales bacterium]|nr:hypothetical protein [Desulfobacterales bacterium]
MTEATKPECFGVLYDEVECVDCELIKECKKKIADDSNPKKMVLDADVEAQAAILAADDDAASKAVKASVEAAPVVEVVEAAPVVEVVEVVEAAPVVEVVEVVEAAPVVEVVEVVEAAPAKKKAPKAPKPPKAPKEPAAGKKVDNRSSFKTLMAAGKIQSFVAGNGKTYLKVDDGKEFIYKSQAFNMKNLQTHFDTGVNPFKPGSLNADVFGFLNADKEISFREAFESLKTSHPLKPDSTLMNRAADVLAGAHFFGIARITRKEGRQRFFQLQK